MESHGDRANTIRPYGEEARFAAIIPARYRRRGLSHPQKPLLSRRGAEGSEAERPVFNSSRLRSAQPPSSRRRAFYDRKNLMLQPAC